MGRIKRFPIAPRLKDFDYSGPLAYFITICSYLKTPIFKDPTLVSSIVNILKTTSEKYNFDVYAYCFMPDHLHLLIHGRKGSSLKDLMREFKQRTEYYFRYKFPYKKAKKLWQRSYYDHVLRKEEALEEVARYILENPVRRRLVKNYIHYPFSGSIVFNIDEL